MQPTNAPLIDRVAQLVDSVVERHGATIYDLEFAGGSLRVLVNSAPEIDIDAIADISRDLARELDQADPIPGSYELEVSTPGLERRLRQQAHFEGALGEQVTIKMLSTFEGERRIKGVVDAVADGVVTVIAADSGAPTMVDIDLIERATTVFEWGPGPKPGGPKTKKGGQSKASKSSTGKSNAGKSKAGKSKAGAADARGCNLATEDHESELSSDETNIGGTK